MSNSPYDEDDRLQGCPMRNCEGQAEINPETDLVTCSQSGCVLFYDENAVTVELWEALPREALEWHKGPPAVGREPCPIPGCTGIGIQNGSLVQCPKCGFAVLPHFWRKLQPLKAQQSADPDCEVCQEWIEKRIKEHVARGPKLRFIYSSG